MRTKSFLIAALLFPIIVLLALTFYKKHLLESGYEVTLKIVGYDPRDLLSGHYLIYTIDYGISDLCRDYSKIQQGYICLDTKKYSPVQDWNCKHFIRGTCKNGRFIAGIEKFYIPENKAKMFDNKIRGKQASIVFTVSPEGSGQIKDLLIDGQSWRKQ